MPDENQNNSLYLRPRARFLRTFGDELISSESVAVVELVKNAYDADASRVLIRLVGPLEQNLGRIEVLDNGHGMSLEVIRSAWMEPATTFKKKQQRTEAKRRRMLGEKGIGRFAASKLANTLEVVTRRTGSADEVIVLFDWSQFDNDDLYLDEVHSLWEERRATELVHGGLLDNLFQHDKKQPPSDELNHGTLLRMEGFRSRWDEARLEGLRTTLSRLVLPSFDGSVSDDFQIQLDLPAAYAHLSGVVTAPEVLNRPQYSVSGTVDRRGNYDVEMILRGQPEPLKVSGRYQREDGFPSASGPFTLRVRVWDRDEDSLADLAALTEQTISQVRGDLDRAAGISVYRDEFRVLPYGEHGNDWLRLDARRVNNPTLRLSNSQIVGYVQISADGNPYLRDQSNREGLISGPPLDDLRNQVTKILAELEARRRQFRLQATRNHVATKPQGIFSNFDLGSLRDAIRQRHPEDQELVGLVEDNEKDLKRKVGQVQEVLSRYRRLATLGQLIDTVLHEGRAPLAKMNNDAELALRTLDRAQQDTVSVGEMRKRFEAIRKQGQVLASVFKRIEPFGGRNRGEPEEIRIEAVVAQAFNVLDAEIQRLGIQVDLPITQTSLIADEAEIQQIVVNLLDNSLYWLREVQQTDRRLSVQVAKLTSGQVQITFSDSGPGIPDEFRDLIFAPYFSAKDNGIGLGLSIVGEIVAEYYAGQLELIEGGPLPGATFRITLNNRK